MPTASNALTFPDSDADLWRAVLRATGQPAAVLARRVGIDPRTARHWLEGHPMSRPTRALVRVLLACPAALAALPTTEEN